MPLAAGHEGRLPRLDIDVVSRQADPVLQAVALNRWNRPVVEEEETGPPRPAQALATEVLPRPTQTDDLHSRET